MSGDFNQDGNLDLAVANAGSSTVSIFLGKGDGISARQQLYRFPADAWTTC